ncbi:hypothetical protein Efla_001415 [Eimeria flavescens]
MRPLITRIVEENWLETRDSLRALTADQWSQLRLPLRLETALKAKLGISDSPAAAAVAADSSSNSSGEAVPSRAAPLPAQSPTTPQQQQQQQQQQEYSIDNGDAPEGLFVCTIEEALDGLQRGHDKARALQNEELKEALSVLLQLVLGVLQQPAANRKRKVRLANPTFNAKVGRHEAALRVLLSVGFAEERADTEVYYVLRTAYLRRLVICYRLMAEIAAVWGVPVAALPAGYFDPALPKSAAEARAAEAREIERQIKRREQLLATGGGAARPPLRPQVFTVEAMRQQDRMRQQQQQQQQRQQIDDWESVSAPVSFTPADILRIRQVMGEGPAFQSRAKQQLQQLQKRTVFSECIVRLLLPDNFVLQLSFSPADSLAFVRETAKQFLHADFSSDCLKWYICETPPLRRFPENRTLYEEGLAPQCLLHVKLEVLFCLFRLSLLSVLFAFLHNSAAAPPLCLNEEALRAAGVCLSSHSSSSSSSSGVNRAGSPAAAATAAPSQQQEPPPAYDSSSSSINSSSSSSSSSSKSRRTLSRLLGSKGPKK